LGAVLFSFQIYGDFSGYSDIALGTSRLFGIELLRNFNFPYFSRDIAEFWRRWHISLSSWFKDYLYIPLGGSKGGNWMKVRNTFIIFIISGFWHGANWTFIAWGALNAFLIMPSILLATNRNNLEIVAKNKLLPSFKELLQIVMTFTLTTIAWVFFRSLTITDALLYLKGIVSNSAFTLTIARYTIVNLFLFIGLLLIVEWFQRQKKHGLDFQLIKVPMLLRWSVYVCLIFGVLLFNGESKEFIYFQF
jgi:D-alanyl-lipoteichoic acid acyltransferase DltB (MBOAT superfamily)